MKPDWKDAPDWANWLSMDSDGAWWWHENEPHINEYGFWDVEDDAGEKTSAYPYNWKKTLEARPKEGE